MEQTYRLNLQHSHNTNATKNVLIKSRSSGKLITKSNEVESGISTTSATTTATTLRGAKLKIEAMQQKQQQQQQQQLQNGTTNTSSSNIILLRGTRNENGQIIIQNKQDILSLLQSGDQQQDKGTATAITLNQLPTATTVARKTILQSSSQTSGPISAGQNANSTISIVASGSGNKDSNTILLQTPINASQLESVLKAQERNKQTKLIERPFMLKHASRSLSTESNTDSKSPFVLQTLKRLEKSQSILVIRNSTAASAAATAATSSATISMATTPPLAKVSTSVSNMSSNSSNISSIARTTKAAKGMAATLHKLKLATASVSATAAPPPTTTTTTTTGAVGTGTAAAGGATISSSATTILRLGKSATTLAINGGSGKVETTATTTAAPTTSNKLSSTVTTEQQQQQLQSTATTNVPLGNDGEPIKLPDNLESLPRADSFPSQRHRWNTNEEIAAILISFDKHSEWQSKEVRTRPKSGSLLLYSRKKVRYRRDGYCWKKRKDGKTTREDHMKLKVQGTECIYGCYVHSAILPTFHRRCYWLLQNPDIVLVHYLNVPYPDDNKMAVIAPSITLWGDKKEWTKEELVSQLKPMLSTVNSDDDSDSGNDIEISTAETVESIVCQLMEKQRQSRQAALVKQLDCGCGDSGCADGKTCTHPVMRRSGGILKSVSEKRLGHESVGGVYNVTNSGGGVGGAAAATPNVVVASKLYSRWSERQRQQQQQQHLDANNLHGQFHNATQQLPQESAIKFQIIPPQQQQQQQTQESNNYQQYRSAATNHQQLMATRSNLVIQQQQQQQQQYQLQRLQHLNNNHQRLQIANTTITATTRDVSVAGATTTTGAGAAAASVVMDTELIENQSHMTTNKIINPLNNNNNNNGKQLSAQTNNELNVVNHNNPSNNNNNNTNNNQNFMYNQHQQLNASNGNNQQQQQQHYYKLQQAAVAAATATPSQAQPPVEAMCMSPEHRSSTSNNNATTATTSSTPSSSQSSVTSSSTSSSLQSIIDGNQQQQITTTSSAAAAATETCDNLMSEKMDRGGVGGGGEGIGIGVGGNCNRAKQNHHLRNGCAHTTFSASSDNSSQISVSDESSNNPHTISSSNSIGSSSSSSSSEQDEPLATEGESMSFFNETLDLSQEDIQRTLIANMPYSNGNVSGTGTTGEEGTGTATTSILEQKQDKVIAETETATVVEADEESDDVFANLDPFDMLVEFPELDLDDKQALNNTALEQGSYLATGEATTVTTTPTTPTTTTSIARKVHNICDFSPEWSYTEGGVKVLVAGPWSSSQGQGGAYTVLFDGQPVPTELVQEGVLRCYCPAHEAGFVSLQVACGGFLVSNSVMFEYKLSLLADAPFDASSSNDCLYKFTLLNRLSTIDEKLQVKAENELTTDHTALYMEPNFEEKLVSYCHRLTKHSWSLPNCSTIANWSVGLRGMTLLHLAAALGYAKLVGAMLNWRAENPHIILETELDALSQDVYGFTPLAWSCVRGHVECSLLLYKWNHNALKIKTQAQQTPLDLANLRGHKQLLSQMYRLEKERCRKPHLRGGLANLSMNMGLEGSASDTSEQQTQQAAVYGYEAGKHHDGVFLRPVAITSNQSPPNNSSRYSKRSSIDSGINMDIRSKSGKSLSRLHSTFDSHDNYNLGVDSPLDSLTGTNCLLSPLRKMDFALCEVVSTGESSPINDKDLIESGDECSTSATDVTIGNELALVDVAVVGDSDAKVLTLAEHIIAAMPERIKNEADEMMVLGSPLTEPLTSESSALTDSFMDPLLDSLPNTHFDSDFSFDFHEHGYRYHDVSTPCSSLSPASSGPLQSPASYSILGTDPSVSSPSPPPSTKQLTEFLHASSLSQYPFEADFSKLTLTDTEQRELYEAAKCIQKAYRSYKGRQKMEEQNKERTAAIVIQNYYRRYKQYAYYRQMTNAALVIQHGYRSYRRNKRFKNGNGSHHGSSVGSSSNSQCLSSFYDHYKQDQQQQQEMGSQPSTPKETSPSGPLKRTYSQSTQNQAARKIQQFMRQSRINIWDGNLMTLTTERTSRKREAGAPTQGGIPSKLAVSRATGNITLPRK